MVVMELPLQCTSQEEQAGGSSANYDVELIHLAEAHRDILRAGVCVCVGTICPKLLYILWPLPNGANSIARYELPSLHTAIEMLSGKPG